MKSVMLAVLFIAVCLASILTGVYTYLGSVGTEGCRADSMARVNFFVDPAFSYERQYYTLNDLKDPNDLPQDIAEQYKESAREGYVLAMQGNWDKLVMLFQTLLLFAAGVAGLISLKRPNNHCQ